MSQQGEPQEVSVADRIMVSESKVLASYRRQKSEADAVHTEAIAKLEAYIDTLHEIIRTQNAELSDVKAKLENANAQLKNRAERRAAAKNGRTTPPKNGMAKVES